jgi:endonuclease III
MFQEYLRNDPFWMLVACQLVNITTWEKQARPAFEEIRRRYGSPAELARAKPEELHGVLRPLGLWRRRSVSLVRMARAWVDLRPTTHGEVRRLPGCGKYASDSWAIFVENQEHVFPTDKKLREYLRRNHLTREKNHGQ